MRLSKITIFPKLSRVLRYKLLHAFLLASVPLLITALALALLTVFTKLNLYHLESLGVIVNEDLRAAYYDQVIDQLTDVGPQMLLLIFAVFVIGFIMMNWATSPFTRAKAYIDYNVLGTRKRKRPYDMSLSEDPVFETLVREFASQVMSGSSLAASVSVEERPRNFRFIAKYVLTFSIVSFLSGISFSSIFFVAYDKIVSLGLQLVQGRKLGGHYFNAQQEILSDTLHICIVVSVVIYFWIGRHIIRHMNLNLYAFSKAISEQRFPIAIRRREVYHEFADSLNRAYAKHKQSRI